MSSNAYGFKEFPTYPSEVADCCSVRLLRKICHIYLNNIVIWSNPMEQHTKHAWMVLAALHKVKRYCNPKKCHVYLLELEFLGHHITQYWSKHVQGGQILNWPIPTNTTEVHSFFGLIRYISWYLPNLADSNALMTKEAHQDFPTWTTKYNTAFWGH